MDLDTYSLKPKEEKLNPCKECLIMHAARANNQVGIWRCYLAWEPDMPYLIDHGCLIDALHMNDWISCSEK